MEHICAGFPIWELPVDWECPTCKHAVKAERMTSELIMEIFSHEQTHGEL